MEDVIADIKSMLSNTEKFNEFALERFAHTDRDGNELIDQSELEKAMLEIAEEMGAPKPSKATVEKTLKKYDKDKSGKLDRNEFNLFARWVLENFLKAMEENS